ncbi:MAG: hypothetical protein F6J89_08155 [Symploca sp. SIO1C4]|uniref:Uncharacterized protein n=1 Tax=Symploca sp. SIO1C4 TaxID=2607765 RepID=A0A6B3N9P5_9CYAN|nr:hypothetical protein [Symploca sp. SIO1C4]
MNTNMPDAEQIIKRFSMCIYFRDSHRGTGTILVQGYDPTLKVLIEDLVESDPDASEEDWIRSFLKGLITSIENHYTLLFGNVNTSVTFTHIIFSYFCQKLIFSYLQLICFYAARQISDKLKKSPSIGSQYPLEECFLIACEATVNPAKLFKKFNLNLDCPFHRYARTSLCNIIQNRVVRDLKLKSVKFSDNGLLRQLSKRQLKIALKEYGINSKDIEIHDLAWQLFKDSFEEFYPPISSDGGRANKLSTIPLSDQQLEQIATRYNQQLQRLAIETQPVTGQDIKKLLATCVQAARASQNQRWIPLEDHGEIQDVESNTFANLIKTERRQELIQVKETILQEFKSLDKPAQQCLMLWLGLEVNQSDLMVFLRVEKQYQVSRQLQRYQKNILKAVTQSYAQAYLSRTLTAKEINEICKDKLDDIKEYLTIYSRDFFSQILDRIFLELISSEERSILIQVFNHSDEYTQVQARHEKSSTSNPELRSRFLEIKHKAQQRFRSVLEEQMHIHVVQNSSLEKCLTNFVDKWLQQNHATLYKQKR